MAEGQRLEALGQRLRAVDAVMPAPAAKIRGWNLVSAAIEHSSTAHPRRGRVWRLTLAFAAAAALLGAGAVAASASSLPDSPLYPVKGALEQARGLLAFSPAGRLAYHLDLANVRLTEAEAMIAQHRVDLAEQALGAMNDQLQDAAAVVATQRLATPALAADLENRLEQAIAVHDRQLAGLQGEVTNPVAQQAIVEARNRAAQALQGAKNGAAGGTQGNSAGQGQGQGQVQGQGHGQGSGKGTPSPHPTPQK